jgi:hypothetical protein
MMQVLSGLHPSQAKSLTADRTRILTAAAMAFFVLGSLLLYHVPINDSALFEYFGQRLTHGAVLYQDLVDNKLPAIFLLNAAYGIILGHNYFLHALLEAALTALGILTFARIVSDDGLPKPGFAALTFAAFLLLRVAFMRGGLNMTEVYAMLLILASIRLLQRGHVVLAGSAFAVSALFWVPSVFFAGALLYRANSRENMLRVGLGWLAGLVVSGAVILAAVSARSLLELAGWGRQYEADDIHPSALGLSDPHMFAYHAYHLVVLGGIGILVLAALAFVRLPKKQAQWFAWLWVISAFAGAMVNLRFLIGYHYLVPAVPALVYFIWSYLPSTVRSRQVALLAIAALLIFPTLHDLRARIASIVFIAHESTVNADILRNSLPKGAPVAVFSYAPSIFLQSGHPSVGPFETTLSWLSLTSANLAGYKDALARMRAFDASLPRASAVVMASPVADRTQSRILRLDFIEQCTREVAPWKLYVHRGVPSLLCSATRN